MSPSHAAILKRPAAANCRLTGSSAPTDEHKDECKAKIFKKVSKVSVSIMGHENAIRQRLMETAKYKLLTRLRNGAETVMSLLRRVYRVDTMPVRGLVRGRLFFGCKIAALNCKKLFAFRRGGGHYAQSPLLAGI